MNTSTLVCVFGALLTWNVLPAAARPADQTTAALTETQRLNFPDFDNVTGPRTLITPAPPQQAAVPLPSPEFTGVTAVGVLTLLLACRKSILKMVC